MDSLQTVPLECGLDYLHGLMDRARPRWENTSEGITAAELQHALDGLADYMDRSGNSDGEHYMAWLLRMAKLTVMRTNDRNHAALAAINNGDIDTAKELLSPVERYWSK